MYNDKTLESTTSWIKSGYTILPHLISLFSYCNKIRTNEWRQRVQPLSVQGRMLELISDEKSDLRWRSIIYNLPTGVLSFAVRSCIDFLPTFTNLRTWGKRTNAKCKLCHNTQTLLHVLNHCAISLEQSRFTWRHNSILSYLTNELVKLNRNNCAIYADIPGQTITGGTIKFNKFIGQVR
jgi:hypothetical protein